MNIKIPILALLMAVSTLMPTPANGHDSWLIADRHLVNDGDEVWLAFVTGEIFPFGDATIDLDRVAELTQRMGDQKADITGLSPEDHTLSVRGPLHDPGIHVIGCRLRPRLIELEPDLFDRYLRDERAEQAIAQRDTLKRGGASHQPIIEQYTKYSKTIVEVHPADPDDQGYTVPIGHRLEIIPLSNPCRWQAGTTVRVEVRLDGHPWPDIPLSIGHEGLEKHEYVERARTDSNGTAQIRLSRPGHAFIKAHLIRPTDGIAHYAWESFWASLTFNVQGVASTQSAIQSIKAIHGELTPWAVAGYRVGRRALRDLALPRGSDRLVVVHRAPFDLPYTAFVDGLQAATGATLGRGNLRLTEAALSEFVCEFTDQSAVRSLRYGLNESLMNAMNGKTPDDEEGLALRILTMPDEDVLVKAPARDPLRTAAKQQPVFASHPLIVSEGPLSRADPEHH